MARWHVDTLIAGVHQRDFIPFCISHLAMASLPSRVKLPKAADSSLAVESESDTIAGLEGTVTDWYYEFFPSLHDSANGQNQFRHFWNHHRVCRRRAASVPDP
jgi:hypothetical protein